MSNDKNTLNLPKVFISHSSHDKEAVWPIVQHLTAFAALPWVDSLEMRPGDKLFRRISTAIEGTAYLLVMISEHSVNSRWVEEEVRQAMSAEFYDNRIRIIPCLLDGVDLPVFIRDRLYCDFSRGMAEGLKEVLRGIHRERHIVLAKLDKHNPLQLDGISLHRQLSRILTLMAGQQRFFYFIDAIDLLNEIALAWHTAPIKGDPLETFAGSAMRTRNAIPFILPNLSCILSKASDVVVDYIGRDAGLVDILTTVVQRTTMITLYKFWKSIQSASEPNMLESLQTIDGTCLISTLATIDSSTDHQSPPRSIEAHAFDSSIDDLMYIGLQGCKGIFDSRVDVPRDAIPSDTLEKYLGTFPLPPDTEIFRTQWLRCFVPVIASTHVIDVSYSGQYIGNYLDSIGLRKEEYKHFGLN